MTNIEKHGKKQDTHIRILQATAISIRNEGFAGVQIAKIMSQAGLTHGGFYAHFNSKDALIAETIEYADTQTNHVLLDIIGKKIAKGSNPFRSLVDGYLTLAHMRDPSKGCIFAAIGSEVHTASPQVRDAFGRRFRAMVKLVQSVLPPKIKPSEAKVLTCYLVGVLQMARALEEQDGAKLIRDAKRSLLHHYQ